jgi:hypothetical protein
MTNLIIFQTVGKKKYSFLTLKTNRIFNPFDKLKMYHPVVFSNKFLVFCQDRGIRGQAIYSKLASFGLNEQDDRPDQISVLH